MLTLVWNWPKTLLVLCGDSRREPQAIVTKVDASEEQSGSENTGACGKAKRQQMDHIAEKYVGICHYGSVHELVFIQEALKIPEAKATVDKHMERIEHTSSLGCQESDTKV